MYENTFSNLPSLSGAYQNNVFLIIRSSRAKIAVPSGGMQYCKFFTVFSSIVQSYDKCDCKLKGPYSGDLLTSIDNFSRTWKIGYIRILVVSYKSFGLEVQIQCVLVT